MRLTQGPTFFICGVVISARQKFALVFSLIFSLNTLLPAVSLWYGLVQRNAPNPCSTRLSGIVWYGLVGPDMAFGQIQVLYRPPFFKLEKRRNNCFRRFSNFLARFKNVVISENRLDNNLDNNLNNKPPEKLQGAGLTLRILIEHFCQNMFNSVIIS